jgi:hypothetical protein
LLAFAAISEALHYDTVLNPNRQTRRRISLPSSFFFLFFFCPRPGSPETLESSVLSGALDYATTFEDRARASGWLLFPRRLGLTSG